MSSGTEVGPAAVGDGQARARGSARSGRARDSVRRGVTRLERSAAAPWVALALLLVLTGALLYHETRGTTVWFDEWTWVLHRRGGSLSTLLDSHNGHFSLIPVALYKLLFATAGLRTNVPYRLLVIGGHLACCGLLFAYARPRVGGLPALVAAGTLMFFGPGWENLLWPFQITWLLSLAGGLGAMLALDRHDRSGDVAACILLFVALASSGIGVPITIGVVVETVLQGRRRRREWWVVGSPLAVYVLWALFYQHTTITRHAFVAAPSFLATGIASTLGGLFGLGGSTGLDGPGTLLRFGAPLLIAAIALAAWRMARLGRVEPRVAGLAAALLAFWAITALTRSIFADPYSSRYLYVSALLLIVLAVELARPAAVGYGLQAIVAVIAIAAAASNFGAIRDAARLLRDSGARTRADLGALQIARALIPRGYVAQGIPGYPLVLVPAGDYFAAAHTLGTPASSPQEIAAGPQAGRVVADAELLAIHRVSLAAAGSGPIGRGCAALRPVAFAAPGVTPTLEVALPAAGLLLRAGSGPVTVSLRRFADEFQPLATLSAGRSARLAIPADSSPRPWHVQLAASGGAFACALR